MPLRMKLLLIALVAAVFPLAGWRFVAQMELTLRDSHEQALVAASRMLASALPQLAAPLYEQLRDPALLHARSMHLDVEVDGYPDDWGPLYADPEELRDAQGRVLASLYLGSGPSSLNVLLDVSDSSRVDAGPDGLLAEFADQVQIGLRDRFGERRWRIVSVDRNSVVVLPLTGPDGREPSLSLPASWSERPDGYRIELRLPRFDQTQAVALKVLDFPAPGANLPRIAGTGSGPDLGYRNVARLWQEQASLDRLLPRGTRMRVLDRSAYVLARGGNLRPGSDSAEDDDELSLLRWLRALIYRHLLAPPMGSSERYGFNQLRATVAPVDSALTGTPMSAWRPAASQASVILSSAMPVLDGDEVIGVILLEQTSDALLIWTNRALGGLLFGGLLTMLAAAAILFGYAGYLSLRIRTLRNAAENALTPEGRVLGNFPRSSVADEIGDLSRSFARLLDQVSGYTEYLRTLGGKLSHELATPLAVVKSSLENLEQEALPESARIYAERASSGAVRLAALLRTLSQAARIENAIAAAESEEFDLAAVLRGAAGGYRDLAQDREFRLDLPAHPVPFRGAPELLHQALDKLVDNALGYTPPGGWIRLALEPRIGAVDIVLANNGPPLPQRMQDRLFDSLISVRDGRSSTAPHLGLGLYIVRLVAELHQGEVSASDLADSTGVEFRMRIKGMPAA